ncbi:hypothetical protein SDC9_113161 [bioreactor metagenome]|uniref:Uncharacterized protein n=1 Tax=bioreactor metagenome TaxID=1076179 RepID=A0A645BWX9_9ZZZZ
MVWPADPYAPRRHAAGRLRLLAVTSEKPRGMTALRCPAAGRLAVPGRLAVAGRVGDARTGVGPAGIGPVDVPIIAG